MRFGNVAILRVVLRILLACSGLSGHSLMVKENPGGNEDKLVLGKPRSRTSYIICRAQFKMKMWGLLFQNY